MRALRGWKLPVLLIVLLVVVFGVYAAWQVWKVSTDLNAASEDARVLQEAVTSGDDSAAAAALTRMQESARSAAARTDGPVWSVLTWAPVVGDDLDGVRTVSGVLDDLARDGAEPLLEVSRDISGLSPRDGAVDLALVESMREPVARGKAAFEDAQKKLSEHDPAGFTGRLQGPYRDAVSQVDRASRALGTADTALEIMPTMLGAEGSRNYLLVFQNNAEIRAGGGLPGAVSLVEANAGRVSLTRQVAASSFGRTDEPVLPLTDAEDEIWNRQLGTFFLDANFTPDFPRTAELWQARWEQEYETVDGVLTVDPVTLSYLLGATGPIEVPGGPALTSENAVDELLHQVYLRYEDPADQDAYFTAVAAAVFDRFLAGSEDPRTMIEALARGTDEGRVKVHSFDDAEQAALAGSRIAGELVFSPTADPQVGAYLNDVTGAKMSYFLRHDVQVTANSCVDGVQRLTGRAYLLSDAPENAASLPDYVTGAEIFGISAGSQRVAMQIIGPVGGAISDVQFNGAEIVTPPAVDLEGRPVVTVLMDLEPKFTADVEWHMTTGSNQTGNVSVETTAGIEPEKKDRTVPSACS
ncbi:DUF4012 domain-containing protein [Nocardioides alkalitolerans]|uniref:DUF4012 domain-containing protein n=1 Tax=Nocardioides alkalitolerans TaxID=281714 RepID=UPI000406F8E8|nr:DUF4012 domain-containing protein [Nocardioides alkalitolerans]